MRILRLIENMTLGRNAVGYLTESMHGAGSPQAQRIQIQRQMQIKYKLDGSIATGMPYLTLSPAVTRFNNRVWMVVDIVEAGGKNTMSGSQLLHPGLM